MGCNTFLKCRVISYGLLINRGQWEQMYQWWLQVLQTAAYENMVCRSVLFREIPSFPDEDMHAGHKITLPMWCCIRGLSARNCRTEYAPAMVRIGGCSFRLISSNSLCT